MEPTSKIACASDSSARTTSSSRTSSGPRRGEPPTPLSDVDVAVLLPDGADLGHRRLELIAAVADVVGLDAADVVAAEPGSRGPRLSSAPRRPPALLSGRPGSGSLLRPNGRSLPGHGADAADARGRDAPSTGRGTLWSTLKSSVAVSATWRNESCELRPRRRRQGGNGSFRDRVVQDRRRARPPARPAGCDRHRGPHPGRGFDGNAGGLRESISCDRGARCDRPRIRCAAAVGRRHCGTSWSTTTSRWTPPRLGRHRTLGRPRGFGSGRGALPRMTGHCRG